MTQFKFKFYSLKKFSFKFENKNIDLGKNVIAVANITF